MYAKSKSTVSQSVSQSVTRSPIELFWTAKKDLKPLKHFNPSAAASLLVLRHTADANVTSADYQIIQAAVIYCNG